MPQLQQSSLHSQPLNTSAITMDAYQMNLPWNYPNGHQPPSPAAISPHAQGMNPSSYNWNGQPDYAGPNGQLADLMQQRQQPVQTHQPTQYNWSGQPVYPGPNGQLIHPMQQRQQPLQTQQPVQSAEMLYAMEQRRKAERNEKMVKSMKKGCADGCRSAPKMFACCTSCVCGVLCTAIKSS